MAVLVVAALTALYWWQHDASRWLPITVAVLVITCPCALSLATPMALTAATGQLTRLGLLVTRGHALETLARATHFVFDKTGTLTVGRPRLLETRTFSTPGREDCLRIAAALERHSEHPLAFALCEAAGDATVPATDVINTPVPVCGARSRPRLTISVHRTSSANRPVSARMRRRWRPCAPQADP